MHELGSYIDSRDGRSYKTVCMLDGKTWMAENFGYRSPGSMPVNDYDPKKYGLTYSFEEAQMACPSGCRLPTENEWLKLCGLYENSVERLLATGFNVNQVPFTDGSSHGQRFSDTVATFWSSTRPKNFGIIPRKDSGIMVKFSSTSLLLICSECSRFGASIRYILT